MLEPPWRATPTRSVARPRRPRLVSRPGRAGALAATPRPRSGAGGNAVRRRPRTSRPDDRARDDGRRRAVRHPAAGGPRADVEREVRGTRRPAQLLQRPHVPPDRPELPDSGRQPRGERVRRQHPVTFERRGRSERRRPAAPWARRPAAATRATRRSTSTSWTRRGSTTGARSSRKSRAGWMSWIGFSRATVMADGRACDEEVGAPGPGLKAPGRPTCPAETSRGARRGRSTSPPCFAWQGRKRYSTASSTFAGDDQTTEPTPGGHPHATPRRPRGKQPARTTSISAARAEAMSGRLPMNERAPNAPTLRPVVPANRKVGLRRWMPTQESGHGRRSESRRHSGATPSRATT